MKELWDLKDLTIHDVQVGYRLSMYTMYNLAVYLSGWQTIRTLIC